MVAELMAAPKPFARAFRGWSARGCWAFAVDLNGETSGDQLGQYEPSSLIITVIIHYSIPFGDS